MRRLAVTLLVLLSVGAYGQSCVEEILGTHPVVHRNVSSAYPSLQEALPEFDRGQDLVIVFSGGHTSLYVAEYFFEWNGKKFKLLRDRQVIAGAVAFRIEVGAERVAALRRSLDNQQFSNFRELNCNLSIIRLLGLHGIEYNSFFLFPDTFFRYLSKQGFQDSAGNFFPTTIYSLNRPGRNSYQTYASATRRALVGDFAGYLSWVGVQSSDLQEALVALTPDEELREIPERLFNQERRSEFTQRQILFLQSVATRVEQLARAVLEARFGSGMSSILNGWQSTPDPGSHTAQIVALFANLLAQSVSEVLEQFSLQTLPDPPVCPLQCTN